MTLPVWVKSRWVIVPLVVVVAVLAWNAYVGLHNGGVVEGCVVDGTGRAVADAAVVLLERNFVTHNERQRGRTDAAGRFRFTGNDNHSLQLEAETPLLGRSERRAVRLWFRAQNVNLAEPLRLPGRLP